MYNELLERIHSFIQKACPYECNEKEEENDKA